MLSCVILLCLVLKSYVRFSNLYMFTLFRYFFSFLAIRTRMCPSLSSSGLLLYIDVKLTARKLFLLKKKKEKKVGLFLQI